MQMGDISHFSNFFLGSIVMLIKDSGWKFAEVYEAKSIPHIMSGKAIARSSRAYLSVQSALMTLLIENTMNDGDNVSRFVKIQNFHHSILKHSHDDESFEKLTSEVFHKTTKKIKELRHHQSRTLPLWLLYIRLH